MSRFPALPSANIFLLWFCILQGKLIENANSLLLNMDSFNELLPNSIYKKGKTVTE